MKANDIIELLEAEWPGIRENLREQWHDFVAAYRDIVAALPEEPSRDDIERTADAVCQLMGRYDYTQGLLRGWLGSLTERLLSSAEESLSEQEKVNQIRNRFHQLAKEFTEGKPKEKSQESKACEGSERDA